MSREGTHTSIELLIRAGRIDEFASQRSGRLVKYAYESAQPLVLSYGRLPGGLVGLRQ